MLNPFGKTSAARRIESILSNFDEQVVSLRQAADECEGEIAELAARSTRLRSLANRANEAASNLSDLVAF